MDDAMEPMVSLSMSIFLKKPLHISSNAQNADSNVTINAPSTYGHWGDRGFSISHFSGNGPSYAQYALTKISKNIRLFQNFSFGTASYPWRKLDKPQMLNP
ncbi:MAG: hypothetical protein LBF60_10505 [Treponema sp.]|nr:hypothetical protein [Treponema sp.]